MATIIENLKAAVEFIKGIFDYIMSFFTGFGGGNDAGNAEDTTA